MDTESTCNLGFKDSFQAIKAIYKAKKKASQGQPLECPQLEKLKDIDAMLMLEDMVNKEDIWNVDRNFEQTEFLKREEFRIIFHALFAYTEDIEDFQVFKRINKRIKIGIEENWHHYEWDIWREFSDIDAYTVEHDIRIEVESLMTENLRYGPSPDDWEKLYMVYQNYAIKKGPENILYKIFNDKKITELSSIPNQVSFDLHQQFRENTLNIDFDPSHIDGEYCSNSYTYFDLQYYGIIKKVHLVNVIKCNIFGSSMIRLYNDMYNLQLMVPCDEWQFPRYLTYEQGKKIFDFLIKNEFIAATTPPERFLYRLGVINDTPCLSHPIDWIASRQLLREFLQLAFAKLIEKGKKKKKGKIHFTDLDKRAAMYFTISGKYFRKLPKNKTELSTKSDDLHIFFSDLWGSTSK